LLINFLTGKPNQSPGLFPEYIVSNSLPLRITGNSFSDNQQSIWEMKGYQLFSGNRLIAGEIGQWAIQVNKTTGTDWWVSFG
jgi:hypothetical protein